MQSSPLSSTDRVFTLLISGKKAPLLRAGETVTAEVLSLSANAIAAIRLTNTVLNARAEVPLRKGDLVTLRVERQENTVSLRLTDNATEQADCGASGIFPSLNNFENGQSGAGGMVRLVELLKRLPETLQEKLHEISIVDRFLLHIDHLTGKKLKDVVENGGVFFENKLRVLALGIEADGKTVDFEAGRIIANDLKASLMRLKDTFLTTPGVLEKIKNTVRPDELIDALNTVLRNIEFYQLRSKLGDTLQFFLPLAWTRLRDGELVLRETDRGKPRGRSYSCIVNLDLENTGKLTINLLLDAGYIHATCAAENSGFSRTVQDGAGLLKQRFSASGLRLGTLSVRHQPVIHFNDTHAEGLSIRR